MIFKTQFNYLIKKRTDGCPLFATYYRNKSHKSQSLELLEDRIDKYKLPQSRTLVCDNCDQYVNPDEKIKSNFLPQRYSTSDGDKQLVTVLNYLFGSKYQGYIAGKWFTVLYDDVDCFHEEICIFNPSESIKFVNILEKIETGGTTNKHIKCEKPFKIYEYSDDEFKTFNEFKPLKNINKLLIGGEKMNKSQLINKV